MLAISSINQCVFVSLIIACLTTGAHSLHNPVSWDPALARGEDTNGGQEFLICYVDVLIDNDGVKVVAVQTLDAL